MFARVVVCISCFLLCFPTAASACFSDRDAENIEKHVVQGRIADTPFSLYTHYVPFANKKMREMKMVHPQVRITFCVPYDSPAVIGIKHYNEERVPQQIKSMENKRFILLFVAPF